MKNLCIYHANCMDGFTSAWILHHGLEIDQELPVDYLPARYGDTFPEIKDYSAVYILDFSYPKDVLESAIDNNPGIMFTVLDHHRSAEKELKPLIKKYNKDKSQRVLIRFDQEKSGCGMTWDYFYRNSGAKMPPLAKFVEDRDLWQFKLPKTRTIMAYLFAFDFNFGTWDMLNEELKSDKEKVIEKGEILLKKYYKDLEKVLGQATMLVNFAGYKVQCANVSPLFASEAGHKLAVDYPFSITYYIDKHGDTLLSFRSSKDGIDVSEIAKKIGGGGHKNAAGAKVKGVLSFIPTTEDNK